MTLLARLSRWSDRVCGNPTDDEIRSRLDCVRSGLRNEGWLSAVQQMTVCITAVLASERSQILETWQYELETSNAPSDVVDNFYGGRSKSFNSTLQSFALVLPDVAKLFPVRISSEDEEILKKHAAEGRERLAVEREERQPERRYADVIDGEFAEVGESFKIEFDTGFD